MTTTASPADVAFALQILQAAEERGDIASPKLDEVLKLDRGASQDDLIADAAAKLGITKLDDDEEVAPADADAAMDLYLRAESLKKIIDSATKERDKITKVFKSTVPEGAKLVVRGSVIFHNNIVASRVLDQASVKNEFPDVPGNERFYKDQISTRAEYKR
jgi:hypothetical protein